MTPITMWKWLKGLKPWLKWSIGGFVLAFIVLVFIWRLVSSRGDDGEVTTGTLTKALEDGHEKRWDETQEKSDALDGEIATRQESRRERKERRRKDAKKDKDLHEQIADADDFGDVADAIKKSGE